MRFIVEPQKHSKVVLGPNPLMRRLPVAAFLSSTKDSATFSSIARLFP